MAFAPPHAPLTSPGGAGVVTGLPLLLLRSEGVALLAMAILLYGRYGRSWWLFVALVMAALWWMDRSRAGAVLRAVGEDEVAAQSAGINVTGVKVAAMTVGGLIAGLGGGIFAHYTAHIEHAQFGVALATFAIAYPILGGLSSVFGTLIAVIFVQGFLIEGLRFLGDWRNLLFGGLILLAMNVRPRGLIDAATIAGIKRMRIRNREPGNARTQGAE